LRLENKCFRVEKFDFQWEDKKINVTYGVRLYLRCVNKKNATSINKNDK